MSLTPEQEIKIELVVLAEYLQCNPLSDAQIKLYAAELADLGVTGLRQAIALLKQDADLWPGKFPLPGKIRSCLLGGDTARASELASRIMRCHSVEDIMQLGPLPLSVAKDYGIKAILEREFNSTSTIYAQVRDAIKARITTRRIEESDGLRHLAEEARREIAGAKGLLVSTGDGPHADLVPGRPFDESEG